MNKCGDFQSSMLNSKDTAGMPQMVPRVSLHGDMRPYGLDP